MRSGKPGCFSRKVASVQITWKSQKSLIYCVHLITPADVTTQSYRSSLKMQTDALTYFCLHLNPVLSWTEFPDWLYHFHRKTLRGDRSTHGQMGEKDQEEVEKKTGLLERLEWLFIGR